MRLKTKISRRICPLLVFLTFLAPCQFTLRRKPTPSCSIS